MLKYGCFMLKCGQYYVTILSIFNKRFLDVYYMRIIFLSDNKV